MVIDLIHSAFCRYIFLYRQLLLVGVGHSVFSSFNTDKFISISSA